jgi:hypothetical protein
MDIMSITPVVFTGIRLEDGKEKRFELGQLMDRVNGRGTNTTLLTAFDANHSGVLTNFRVYPGLQVRDSQGFWMDPYPKPILERHPPKVPKPGDPEPKVYGRVRKAQFVQLVDNSELENDWKSPKPNGHPGSGFSKVLAGITDKDAIEQILDGRFMTVSQGSDTDRMLCSVCGHDWIATQKRCDHWPGRTYELQDGKGEGRMYFVTGKMFYDHLARVNQPAQPYSTVLATEFLDQKLVDEHFTHGEVVGSKLASVVLIDSQAGMTELLIEAPPQAQDNDVDWSAEEWAEVYILAALADAGRLKDAVLDESAPRIEQFRASDRKLRFGRPRCRIGPDGCIPICDVATAKATMQLADSVKGVDPERLRQDAASCMGSFVPVSLSGGSTMPDMLSKEAWAAIVKQAYDLLSKDEESCFDWNDYTGDLFDLAVEDGEAEERGVAAGIIMQDARLTTSARKALPESAFCGPNRSFPVHDKAHVRNALARLPQATRFSSDQKARILACVKRRAKSMGVTVSADMLELDKLNGLLDKKAGATTPPPPPPDPDETPEQKIHRLEQQNSALEGKVADLQGQNSRLIDEMTDIRGELHKHLAQQVFDMRVLLSKHDVVALDTEEKKAEYIGKLRLRKTDSLRDSLCDLSAEIDNKDKGTPPPVQNPTAGVTDQGAGAGTNQDGGKGGPASSNKPSQLAALEARLARSK